MSAHAQLFAANELAAKLYTQALLDSRVALDWFRGRGLSGWAAHQFRVGFAPRYSTLIMDAIDRGEIKHAVAASAGLIVQNPDTMVWRDRFSDRVMFPVRDDRGRIIAFGGRILSKRNDNDERPKYLNTSETPIFSKRRNLYGLHEVQSSREKPDSIWLVEGYMDVAMLHRYGLKCAVASLGTSVTNEQVETIFRHTNRLVLCMDGDSAGVKAAIRSADKVLPYLGGGRSASFSFLPDGKDPDEMVRSVGPDITRYQIERESFDMSTWLIVQAEINHPGEGAGILARRYREIVERINKAMIVDIPASMKYDRANYCHNLLITMNIEFGLDIDFYPPYLTPDLSRPIQAKRGASTVVFPEDVKSTIRYHSAAHVEEKQTTLVPMDQSKSDPSTTRDRDMKMLEAICRDFPDILPSETSFLIEPSGESDVSLSRDEAVAVLPMLLRRVKMSEIKQERRSTLLNMG